MTLLNYLLTDDAVYVLADTLLTDSGDLSPVAFATKVHALPHLETVICGTGHAQAIADWVGTVNTELVVRDIVDLDRLAPAELRRLHTRYAAQGAVAQEVATTLYHFGLDTRAGCFVGFAYASAGGFRSEPLPPGFGLKPAPDWPVDGLSLTRLPEHLIAVAEKQKAQDAAAEAGRRVMVGGKLIFCAMQRVRAPSGGPMVQTSLAVCHDFPDFERLYAEAAAKFPRA
jgi:hypothetical protein